MNRLALIAAASTIVGAAAALDPGTAALVLAVAVIAAAAGAHAAHHITEGTAVGHRDTTTDQGEIRRRIARSAQRGLLTGGAVVDQRGRWTLTTAAGESFTGDHRQVQAFLTGLFAGAHVRDRQAGEG